MEPYSFDGRSYIVTSSNLNLLPLGKTNRSFSLWMKSNITTDPPNRDMFNWGTYLTSQRFGFTMYSARPYFVGQNNDFYGNGNIGDNLWHHVIVTYDGTRVVIYIDGLYNAAATKNLNTQVPQVIIGRSPLNHPAPTYFNGQMDDIFIYNRVLSESEIQQLYSPKQKILWSTGDTTSSIAVKPAQTTTYYVTVTDGITICRDSVRVTVFDPVSYNPLPDKTIASSDSVILDAGAGYTRYQWSNGSSARNITVRSTGLYKVTVTTPQGCIATDSSFVQFADTVGVFIPVVNAVCNMPVDVPIKAYKFRNMLTMQGSINWDTSGLRFESVSNFGPPAMSMGAVNFGTTQTSEGRIAFSWNDAIVKGVTLSDSTTLFVLRFMPIGSTSKRITVNIVNSPTPLEFIDINYNKQVTVIRNGEIHLTCDGIVAGRIITPLDQGIPNVVLTLAGTDITKATMTDRDGNYSLRAVSGSYILAPGKNNEKHKTNGISTMDIAMIQSHILQKDLLNSPFKIIAGDANSSGTVSTADLLYIRRMVLNVDTSFPGNKTWAFVDANHTFSNPQNPFPYPSNKTFTNFSGNMSQSFRAIKLGDVNFDRNPLLDNPQGLKDTLRLYYETTTLKDNGTVIVQLRVKDVKNLLGFQYTVNWDKHKLLYQGIGANPLKISVGEGWVDDGYLVLSWNDPEAGGIQLKEGDLLFELNYHTDKNFDKARLGISSDKVSTEVFNSQYELLELRLEASDILKPQELASVKFKIYPNPAETVINVQWSASVEGVGYIHLFDLSGRKVYEEKVNVNAGDNKFSLYLNKGRFARGTYVLQLTSEKNVYVKKVKIGNE